MRCFMLSLPVVLLLASNAFALATFGEVKASHRNSDGHLLDRQSRVIHELRVDSKGRRLEWVTLDAISPALIRAVISSEDRNFFEHRGVDWKAAGAAAIGSLFGRARRGASTITMQLASMLDRDLRPKGAKRTISQKWDQMKAAGTIEREWTKGQILEAYLNLVTFRGELQGVAASARGLFGKEPHGLDEKEALLLAALIRSPNAPAEDVARRACLLAESMRSPAGCDELMGLSVQALAGPHVVRQRTALAPHVAHTLLKAPDSSVRSTLDGDLQRFAAGALSHHIGAVRSQNVTDGAVLVVENRTGEVLAYVGNIGTDSPARYVDGVRAKRQAGSTLKPFLYALALEQGLLTPASLLEDNPLDVPTATGLYRPENYENDFKGMVSVRTALASSLNVPAVRVLQLTGVEPFVRKLGDLGFSHLESEDHYGLSVALGSADVSLYELVNAYRALANGGIRTDMTLTPGKGGMERKRVFSGGTAFLVSDILSDREARSMTFGFENPLATRFWAAVKTGTSKDMRDNWCIGFSRRYTVGVWVGNFSGQAMWNVSGVTGAAPVWLEIMNRLHKDVGSGPPQRPGGIVAKKVEFKDGTEAPRVELFARATEASSISVSGVHDNPRITYPANGTIIALDPDIPEEHQIVYFEAQAAHGPFRWVLDNGNAGPVNGRAAWRPTKGRHVLSLLDGRDKVIDSVRFVVRGSGSAPLGGR